MTKRFPTVGACGLDCILCPRYYTEGKSRCAGCGSEYSSAAIGCKIHRCCVKEKNLGTCAECGTFPCSSFEGVDATDSFVTHSKMVANLHSIKVSGVEAFLGEQETRRGLLDRMLHEYNDGRSKSYFCVATTLLPIDALRSALDKSDREVREGVENKDMKRRATILRGKLTEAAMDRGIDLELRKTNPKEPARK